MGRPQNLDQEFSLMKINRVPVFKNFNNDNLTPGLSSFLNIHISDMSVVKLYRKISLN